MVQSCYPLPLVQDSPEVHQLSSTSLLKSSSLEVYSLILKWPLILEVEGQRSNLGSHWHWHTLHIRKQCSLRHSHRFLSCTHWFLWSHQGFNPQMSSDVPESKHHRVINFYLEVDNFSMFWVMPLPTSTGILLTSTDVSSDKISSFSIAWRSEVPTFSTRSSTTSVIVEGEFELGFWWSMKEKSVISGETSLRFQGEIDDFSGGFLSGKWGLNYSNLLFMVLRTISFFTPETSMKNLKKYKN